MKTPSHMTPISQLGGIMLTFTKLAGFPRGHRAVTLETPQRSKHAGLLTLAALFLARALLAQGWFTIDDFQYSPGTNAFATGLAKDPSGTIIYSAGGAQDASGFYHALAFKSSDQGTSWSLMDDYIEPASAHAGDGPRYYAGTAVDPAGNIYASGHDHLTATGAETWFTRRSADAGVTWSTVDTLSYGTGLAQPHAVATDAAGNVYVLGEVQTNAAAGGSVWIVRKGTGGTNWATVAKSGLPSNGVFCHPTAGVFVVGQGLGPGVKSGGQTVYPQVWTVRRSQDGGATWTTVDSFQFVQKNVVNGASAYGAGADLAGNLYVVGDASSHSGGLKTSDHWIVRKSTDGGNSWSTVDDLVTFTGLTTSSPTPRAFGCDATGNFFVAGTVRLGPSNGSAPTTQQWLVRESPGGSGGWQTVDTFQYVSGGDSEAYAVTCDSSGHTFVAGYGTDAAGAGHWIVRKR